MEGHDLLASARLESSSAEGHSKAVTLLSECPICLWPVDGSRQLHKLQCGHTFCHQCWLDYVISRVSEGVSTGKLALCVCKCVMIWCVCVCVCRNRVSAV